MRQNKKREAFTLLEMVVVMVVMGILSAALLPKIDRNFKQEVTDYVLSDIRFTEYLATTDFKQSNDDHLWQREFWSITFGTCLDGGIYTSISTDMDKNAIITKNETVVDSMTGKYMYASPDISCKDGGASTSSERIFLTDKYNVSSVRFTGGCANTNKIGFDHLGRPHVGFESSTEPNYSSIMDSACIIDFGFKDGKSLKVSIAPETGYVTKL